VTGTAYDDAETPATNYVKWLLNILLGLVSFLALVMVIYAFYLIFFSKGEEAVTKARKILVGVAIALAIM
jgi:flagellar basal body-associated protein FliL